MAITNRKQLSLPEESIGKQAKQAYNSIKKTENIIRSGNQVEMLNEVGKKVSRELLQGNGSI